jgi:hypothetical protein
VSNGLGWGAQGAPRALNRAVKVELTDEERSTLLRLLDAALEDPKYPLSLEVETLRTIAEKLRGAEGRKARR